MGKSNSRSEPGRGSSKLLRWRSSGSMCRSERRSSNQASRALRVSATEGQATTYILLRVVKRMDEPTRDGWLTFQSTEGAETTDFGALPRYLEAKRGAVKVPEALASKLNHLIDLA